MDEFDELLFKRSLKSLFSAANFSTCFDKSDKPLAVAVLFGDILLLSLVAFPYFPYHARTTLIQHPTRSFSKTEAGLSCYHFFSLIKTPYPPFTRMQKESIEDIRRAHMKGGSQKAAQMTAAFIKLRY